ncbi:MAG TPA: NAD-dependent epimerase/dehydratase family protein [Chthonomonadaceae bacterium]|nr:NAD-dependent epimerase/dehydratase family protein [Chthonomonadaceae bacterium]
MTDLAQKISKLQGPILVLGGSGFIGANLLRMLLACREDVVGTATHLPAWRLDGLPEKNVRAVDLLVDSNLDNLLHEVRPRTLFNCVAYGAYSFETDSPLIYQTNFNLTARLLSRLESRQIACYVHAGSSSEYGDHASGPEESDLPAPNSDYAVSKVACANLLHYYGTKKGLPCANLRLYSVYGPMEDSSRLIPAVMQHGVQGRYPEFVHPDISRDFVYVEDACEAFIDAALNLKEEDYGESFNIGTGCKTTIGEVATLAGEIFQIGAAPVFTMPNRHWDVSDWFANTRKAKERLGWQARTSFEEGLRRTLAWYESLEDRERYHRASKKFGLDTKHSVSAIVACYRNSPALPVLYERLKTTFAQLRIEYEIVFVNDGSPDDSEEVIRALSRSDRRVIGISHSRNFGAQAAFKSGMEIATKNACVLLDGDLQDPPELIEQFVAKWREGYDVVYGRQVQRPESVTLRLARRLFYRLFDAFSYLSLPHDAGDFALLDKRVVACLLQFPERDLFLRGVRAFVGFKQTGVDYTPSEPLPGARQNSLVRNFGWAKRGLLSFSNTPLTILSFFGSALFLLTLLLCLGQIVTRLLFPDATPKGLTTVLLSILFFGSINLFALGLIGEYIARIFEEVKQRPHFIRRSIIKDGEIRAAADSVGPPP